MFNSKKNNKILNDIERAEYEPIVFINKPATSYLEDVVGFKSQVETIHKAIDNGANMIGVIADYGTGKSTISDILISDVLNNEHKYSTIRINMWDSISKKADDNDISELTKSFLYQLANGNNDNSCVSKLSRYVSKRMSKNFNTISFSTVSTKLWKYGRAAALSYALYMIFAQNNINFINENSIGFIKFIKDVNPLFFVIALVLLIYGIVDTSIAFSSWKKIGDSHLESNDVFELYDEIATKLVENSYDNKQIVFIEDLDRIDDKTLITKFLKELYRFQNSVSERLKDKFVFIVAIKPEALLKTKKKTSNDIQDNIFEHLYSKVFDVTVNLKPIHFEDYESALLSLFEKNEKSKEKLECLIGEDINEEHLPESFSWILMGENLTLRDLKDRLNHAISIMVSLKNKNYKDTTTINFTACTAVAYLESAFPKEFYNLVKSESKFEKFIRESYSIKNGIEENKKDELLKKFNEIFYEVQQENTAMETDEMKFIDVLCKLVLDNVFDDDFRMYFYTYPDNSYIKTVDEKDVCNLIKLPTVFDDVTDLDEKVNRIFANRPNSIVIDTIKSLDNNKPYPIVLILNGKLFELAAEYNFEKALDLLCRYTLKLKTQDEYILSCLKMINTVQIKRKKEFISCYVKTILDMISNDGLTREQFLDLRKNIILAFEKNVVEFISLFVNTEINVPIITEDEINNINNIDIILMLVDKNLISVKMEYILNKINMEKLSSENVELAFDVYDELIRNDRNNKYLGEHLLRFLHINQIINIEYFNVILETVDELELICKYINGLDVKKLPDEYLKGIDKKAFDKGLNEDVLQRLKDNNLFISYLLTKAPINQIDDINYSDDTVKDNIITASKVLYNKNPSAFILLRKCIIRNMQNVYDKYSMIFEGEYPIITKDELNTFVTFSDAIICIDGSKLNVENCDFVWEYCNQDDRSPEDCLKTFDYLFNSEHDIVVRDSDVAKKLFYALDFDKIKFKELEESQRENAISYISTLLKLDDASEALGCLQHLKALIPTLEKTIQESNLTNEYINFLNVLKQYTDVSIQWVENIELNTALCPAITSQLYNRKKYINYVIGKSLYEQELIYDKNLLNVEQYLDMYIHRQCMFDIMSKKQEFIQDIAKTGLYKQIDNVILIKPLFCLPQTADMMKFIWPMLSENEYSEYLMSIPEIATLDDSKNIKVFLCIDENMDKLGSYQLHDKIDHLLWDTHKTHKKEFNSAWNKRWKKELKGIDNYLL